MGETFFRAAEVRASCPFLAVPANPARAYPPGIGYGEAVIAVRGLIEIAAPEAGFDGRIAHGPMILGMALGLGARAPAV